MLTLAMTRRSMFSRQMFEHSGRTRARRNTAALRELESIDRTMLADIGMSRRELVEHCFGKHFGDGAAFD